MTPNTCIYCGTYFGSNPDGHNCFSREFFCYHCGADWSEWYNLSDEGKEALLDNNPEADISNLEENTCPSCGFSYEDDNEDETY